MIPNIASLVKACKNLNLPFEFIDKNENFVKVKDHYFVNAATPLNNESVARIAEDKDFTYQILKGVVKMPKNQGFLDPFVETPFQVYKQGSSYKEITNIIIKNFPFPLIIKRNSGFRSISVFKCNNKKDIENALSQVFNQHSKNYDYIALAQEFIDIKQEYRVIVLERQVEIIYTKGESPEIITNTKIIEDISNFIKPIFDKLPIKFAGLDIAQDKEGKFCLFEINSKPAFSALVEIGEEQVVKLYEKILQSL